jgi:hypothetical protein
MEQNSQLDVPVVDSDNGYNSAKTYALYVNPKNRHICGMIGFLGGIDYINDGRNFLCHNIYDMTEDEYKEISRSINSNESMTFLGEDNRQIIIRKILVDMLEGTYYDTKVNMMYGVNNEINLRVRCVDNTLTPADDVTSIEIKNIKKTDNPVSFNDQDGNVFKLNVDNPSEIKIKLLGDGVHPIRIKAKIPTVEYLWLTAYPQMIKLKDDELDALNEFIDNRNQPN